MAWIPASMVPASTPAWELELVRLGSLASAGYLLAETMSSALPKLVLLEILLLPPFRQPELPHPTPVSQGPDRR